MQTADNINYFGDSQFICNAMILKKSSLEHYPMLIKLNLMNIG